jgi:hypothetical protein
LVPGWIKRFLFDWMMPAELFPFVLAGKRFAGLGRLARAMAEGLVRRWRCFALCAAVRRAGPGGCQRSGGWIPAGARVWWAIVVGSIALYDLVAVGFAVLGVQLSQRRIPPCAVTVQYTNIDKFLCLYLI